MSLFPIQIWIEPLLMPIFWQKDLMTEEANNMKNVEKENNKVKTIRPEWQE